MSNDIEMTPERIAYIQKRMRESVEMVCNGITESDDYIRETVRQIYEYLELEQPKAVHISDSPRGCWAEINKQHETYGTTKEDHPSTPYLGFRDTYWVEYYRTAREIGFEFTDDENKRLDIMRRTLDMGPLYLYSENCFVSPKPVELHLNDAQVIDRRDGPAVVWADGKTMY